MTTNCRQAQSVGLDARRGVALWRRGDAERVSVGAGRPRGAAERHGALLPFAAEGGFAYVDPDEPAAHGRIVAAREDSPGSATLVQLITVESDRSLPQAADPGRPDMEVTRADKTMIAVRGATPRHYRPAAGSGR